LNLGNSLKVKTAINLEGLPYQPMEVLTAGAKIPKLGKC